MDFEGVPNILKVECPLVVKIRISVVPRINVLMYAIARAQGCRAPEQGWKRDAGCTSMPLVSALKERTKFWHYEIIIILLCIRMYIYINNHNTYYIQHILKYNIICILYMSYIICMYYIYISYIYNPNSFAKVIDIHSPWRRVLADLSGDQSGSIPSTYIKDQHWLVIPNIWCFHC